MSNLDRIKNIRTKAKEEASRRNLDMPNYWAFVCGAQNYAGRTALRREGYVEDFDAGFEWAKSQENSDGA